MFVQARVISQKMFATKMADRHIIYISFTTKNEKQSITSPFSSKAFAWWVAYTISSFQLSNPSITSPLLIKTN